MITIIQQPDSISFSLNLKKFIISSDAIISVRLEMGQKQIFEDSYAPGTDNMIEIDLRKIVDALLYVTVPTTGAVTIQTKAVADFTVTIDETAVSFKAVKGGVADLQELSSAFMDDHFLSWQDQDKRILQYQSEWLSLYAIGIRIVRLTAYFSGGASAPETVTLATVAGDQLHTIDVSWSAICDAISRENPVAWDVWFENESGTRLSYIQRYHLRYNTDQETMFVWVNTLGGIDCASFTGEAEDDRKLEHKVAELYDESLEEYDILKLEEIRQSTGFLTLRESIWLEDFFYSKRRFRVDMDGALKPIVLASSKVVSSTLDDMKQYEFSYRLASNDKLLNLDRVTDTLPAPEGLEDFFLTELLSGLSVATYRDNLVMAVQSPFAPGWMKLPFYELWGGALPGLVDGTTIQYIDGKLRTGAGAAVLTRKPKHGFESPSASSLSFNALTKVFSISSTSLEGDDFPVWKLAQLHKRNTEEIQIGETLGFWYIYYQDVKVNDEIILTLTASMEIWDRELDLPIARIAWDGLSSEVKDYRYNFIDVNHTLIERFNQLPHPAEDIFTDKDKFNELLDQEDTTCQKALETLDKHRHDKIYTPDKKRKVLWTSVVDEDSVVSVDGKIIARADRYNIGLYDLLVRNKETGKFEVITDDCIRDIISEPLIGEVDGVNTVFETSFQYRPNTVNVFINGLKESRDNFHEFDPLDHERKIMLDNPPSTK